jgi:hypothetical protein
VTLVENDTEVTGDVNASSSMESWLSTPVHVGQAVDREDVPARDALVGPERVVSARGLLGGGSRARGRPFFCVPAILGSPGCYRVPAGPVVTPRKQLAGSGCNTVRAGRKGPEPG